MKITLDPHGLLLHEAPGITTVIHRGHPAFSDLIKAAGIEPFPLEAQGLAPDDHGCGWPTYQPDDDQAEEGERLARACADRWNEREADGNLQPLASIASLYTQLLAEYEDAVDADATRQVAEEGVAEDDAP